MKAGDRADHGRRGIPFAREILPKLGCFAKEEHREYLAEIVRLNWMFL